MQNNHVFQGGKWYQKQIEQRVCKALAVQEQEFVQVHGTDSDTQLLEYVSVCASRLGHTPSACEVIGGDYLTVRFGDWRTVLQQAGLPVLEKELSLNQSMLYKQEIQRQTDLFRRQRKLDRERKNSEKIARQQKTKEEKQQREASEAVWKQEHEHDTHQQLLEYIRQCAAELGHTPVKKEVPGNELIRERFGSWAMALRLAGLELPQGMKGPSDEAVMTIRKQLANSKDI